MAASMAIDQKVFQANFNMLNKKFEMQLEEYMEENDLTDAEKKILELKENTEFMNKIVRAESLEEVQQEFANAGLPMSLEDTKEFMDVALQTTNKLLSASDVLSDEELEQIAGGINWGKLAIVVLGAACCAAVASVFGMWVGGLIAGEMGGFVGAGVAATASGLFGIGLFSNKYNPNDDIHFDSPLS